MQVNTIGAQPVEQTKGAATPAAWAAAARRHWVTQQGDRADALDREVMGELRETPGWRDLVAADQALLASAGDPIAVALGFDSVPWAAPAAAGER